MSRVREGDEYAFEAIYRRYNRRLLHFFHGLSRDAHIAEDLSHETFARIWRLRRKYAATGSFPAYVFTIARNIWLEKCRELKKRQRLGSAQSLEFTEHLLTAPVGDRPDEGASRQELAGRIQEAVDALPEDQRMVFVMRTIEGLGLEDIATVLQCPVNTVRSRKLLAVKKLRERLTEFSFDRSRVQ
jgi:RNA polymerase sigma-70 factor (ECF subfamily)